MENVRTNVSFEIYISKITYFQDKKYYFAKDVNKIQYWYNNS